MGHVFVLALENVKNAVYAVPGMLGIATTLFLHWGFTVALLLNAVFWVPQLAVVLRLLYKYKAKVDFRLRSEKQIEISTPIKKQENEQELMATMESI